MLFHGAFVWFLGNQLSHSWADRFSILDAVSLVASLVLIGVYFSIGSELVQMCVDHEDQQESADEPVEQ